MKMFALLPLIFAASTIAAPAKLSGCDLSKASVPLTGSLAAPTAPVHFVALGVGVQNYTCGPTGTYAYVFSLLIEEVELLKSSSTLQERWCRCRAL